MIGKESYTNSSAKSWASRKTKKKRKLVLLLGRISHGLIIIDPSFARRETESLSSYILAKNTSHLLNKSGKARKECKTSWILMMKPKRKENTPLSSLTPSPKEGSRLSPFSQETADPKCKSLKVKNLADPGSTIEKRSWKMLHYKRRGKQTVWWSTLSKNFTSTQWLRGIRLRTAGTAGPSSTLKAKATALASVMIKIRTRVNSTFARLTTASPHTASPASSYTKTARVCRRSFRQRGMPISVCIFTCSPPARFSSSSTPRVRAGAMFLSRWLLSPLTWYL